jgi:hypothetical protein
LIDDGVNIGPLFDVMPTFMGHPKSRQSKCADFFRDAARRGYGSVPKEFT